MFSFVGEVSAETTTDSVLIASVKSDTSTFFSNPFLITIMNSKTESELTASSVQQTLQETPSTKKRDASSDKSKLDCYEPLMELSLASSLF